MKTKLIKSTVSAIAALGLASGAHAQSVGFGLSFNSAGLNSVGFSYGGGNFGVGVGFNTYSPYSYPYYPYYGYTWPAYSTFYWGPTWSYCYPSYSWYYPTCYYPSWYGCHYPYWGYGGYCGWNSGYYYHNSGYYPNNYAAYHTAVNPHAAGYAQAGGPHYVAQAPVHPGMTVPGSAGYQRVFTPAYWDQPQKAIPAHAPGSGVTSPHSPVANPPGLVARGPGYQRVVPTSTIPIGNAGSHMMGTYSGHQPAPIAWNASGSHATYTGQRPFGSVSSVSSPGSQTVGYSPAWYHPGNPASTVALNNGSRPSTGRPIGNVNSGGQSFGGGPRPSNNHAQLSSGNGGYRPFGSVPAGASTQRGGFPGGSPASRGGFGGGTPASHGGFSGQQLAQGPSIGGMGGGHSFGGFHH